MLVKILNKKINIRIDVIINTDIDVLPKEDRAFLRVLMIIFMQKGEMLYLKAMDDWYKMQSLDQWLKKYDIEYDDINSVDNIYRSHKKWCLDCNYNATPSIFINGYKYPKTYPRMNLQFFIDDIVDDKILEENIAYESEQSKLYSYE